MGLQDLELWKKIRGGKNRWERVVLPPNLPPVDCAVSADSTVDIIESQSPPPGRPGSRTEKRDRESTGSEENCSVRRKQSKKENINFAEALKQADLVGDATISPVKEGEGLQRNLDSGIVLSISGTPAKHFNLETPNSPILSSRCSKK